MKAMLLVAIVVSVLGACSPHPPCLSVALDDSAQVFPGTDTVMLLKKSDTIPKPYSSCVTLYSPKKDTIPKP
jgi:hypothetical protein